MATTTLPVDLPKPLIKKALELAARSTQRAIVTHTKVYGPEHMLVTTLEDEHRNYLNAIAKL